MGERQEGRSMAVAAARARVVFFMVFILTCFVIGVSVLLRWKKSNENGIFCQ
jgi:cell division septal protein FtsQ